MLHPVVDCPETKGGSNVVTSKVLRSTSLEGSALRYDPLGLYGGENGVTTGGRIGDERVLAALAYSLGAGRVGQLSPSESVLLDDLPDVPGKLVLEIREQVRGGEDPLGEAFCALRTAEIRRKDGAVYTPTDIVHAMISWAEMEGEPDRVIDPGSGSARFLLEAGRRFPRAQLVGVENDPLAALMARGNLAAAGMAGRSEIWVQDFRKSSLDGYEGRTLFVGNPPYVRHHLIEPSWKTWLKQEAEALGLKASSLAGLHVYFILSVASRAKVGDYGALITAAEWLDVNYGQLVRDLFLNRLGGQSVFIVEPKAGPFPGATTTGAITTFKVNGSPPSARFARIKELADLGDLSGGRRVRRERLEAESRWTHFTRTPREVPQGYAELGELCYVHRGQVTGANRVWIAGRHSLGLPGEVLFPSVTKAMELFEAGWVLSSSEGLRQVIDLPQDLDVFHEDEREAINAFLIQAERMGARESYTARHRKVWWSVGLRDPAPILATYMARRPPAFVLNRAEARHLNIAHGLYPREPLTDDLVVSLVRYLRRATTTQGGREYAGGLTKFEPREMERIPIPGPDILAETAV